MPLELIKASAILILCLGFFSSLSQTGAPTRATSCARAYQPLWKDRVLSIVVAFGYKDARPFRFVADRYEKSFFAERMLAPCQPGGQACGFTRSEANKELFTKTITASDRKPLEVRLRLLTASAGPDDEENRRNPYQRWLSQRAEEAFREGLKAADVVLYSGHSRSGGGPDFRPPVLLKNDHVAYGLYKKRQPGLKMITETLEKNPKSQVEIIGLFSCASSQLFVNAIQAKKKGVAVISSTALLYHADAMSNMIMSIDALMNGDCSEDFAKKIKASDPRAGSRIVGFF